jgi:hypothetical protein
MTQMIEHLEAWGPKFNSQTEKNKELLSCAFDWQFRSSPIAFYYF